MFMALFAFLLLHKLVCLSMYISMTIQKSQLPRYTMSYNTITSDLVSCI